MTFDRSQRIGRRGPRAWALALLALALLAIVLAPATTHAAGITVAASEVAINANGQCSLREAIINANNDAATHADCTAGSGADIINLVASTYSVTDSYVSYSGNTGLPVITTNITIEGNGATIDRNSATVFRLFAVDGSAPEAGNLTLNDLMLTDGAMTSDVGGGAVFNDRGTLTINDSFLSGHSGANSGGGGAIRAEAGTTTINTTTLSGNQAPNSGGGGAIFGNNTATIVINNSSIRSNTAANTAGGGIAISYTGSNSLTITGSTINGNSANSGGGISGGSGTITLTNSTVSGNTSQSNGGGMDLGSTTGTLNNVTVTGNTAGAGGGGGGGGVYSNSTLNLNRNLISGNLGPTGYDSGYELVGNGTENANNYNVFGRSGITNNRAFAFSFTPGATDYLATDDNDGAGPDTATAIGSILDTTLANNGGPTSTHALVAGSPAVDLAPSAACAAAPVNGVDQRGYPRNIDGNASASANECDTGAYEYLSSPPPTTGTIVIVKAATPADDTVFGFTEDITPGNFSLSDPSNDTETFSNVSPGSYTVSEDAAAGWTLDDVTCDDDNSTGDTGTRAASIELAAGETVTCTFSNSRDTGTIVIVKAATPADDTVFGFTEDITPGTFNLSDPASPSKTFSDVPTGNYTVTEDAVNGWSVDTVTCNDANSYGYPGTRSASISLEDGETVTCTFSNSRDTGTIVIVKAATPADDTPFDFNEDITPDTFSLSDPSSPSTTFSDVPTGSYTVSEDALAGWTLDDVTCDDGNSTGDTGTATASIELEKDETVTCTFSNSLDTGTIIIVKEATPADDTPFNFTEDITPGGFALLDPSDPSETFTDVPAGSYTVTEGAAPGWTLDDVSCDDGNSTGNTGTRAASINLEDGETVTCTFSNTMVPPTTDVFVSAVSAGVTDDNLAFGPHDILRWSAGTWSKWFDGSAAGLMPTGPNVHNVMAFWIPDPGQPDVAMTFSQNRRTVPGVGFVDGMDIVWWDGSAFSLWFDGQDVGLTVLTTEKVDSLHVLDGGMAPPALAAAAGGSCDAYLLISTQGAGKVPNYSGGTIKFGGEDMLGFCMTQSGATTTGKWILVLDGSAEGMPKDSLTGLSASADGQTIYLTTRSTFVVDSAVGGHSMVYKYEFASGQFSGPYFSAPAEGLPPRVAGLQVEGTLP